MTEVCERLITGVNVREYFHGAVSDALARQKFSAQEETILYVSNLLTGFVRAEFLYDRTPEGVMIRPLAQIYGEAAAAHTPEDRDRALQRLGDVALFISGLFASSLSRSLVDVDYYIAMGGNAYGTLADSSRVARLGRVVRGVFAELAGHFPGFVDVLSEIGENTGIRNSTDILRLYEIWLSSGSPRAAGRLEELGIIPVKARRSTH